MKKLNTKFNNFLFVLFLGVYLFLVALTLYLSAENGASSSATSGKISDLVATFLNIFGAEIDSKDPTFNNLIRKLVGHFGLFLVTSLTSVFMVLNYKKDDKKKLCLVASSLLIGIGAAFLSEYIQGFASNRGPSVKDAFIDIAGYIIPIIIYICIKIYVHFKDKRSGRVVEL